MPFLEGSRQCIGMSLARLNYGTAVALLLSNFTFRLAADVRIIPPVSGYSPLLPFVQTPGCGT